MPLFLITGLPGSGKSTVCAELKARGYEAYDGDEDGLAKWYDGQGRAIHEKYYRNRSPEFLRQHSRDISREIVEGLATKAQDKPIFLCEDPENEVELNDLFEKVFALMLDDTTRNHRLVTRTNNQWGKLPHEREYSVAYGKKWQEMARSSPAV
ncbi:MAG TPA: AAA family ATPase [Verrucomicrobiae bacterium]|jgi:dephospho-CoA kinase|nr:AAA family ATPase [Verrucomicrobiae bacterium]